MKAAVLAALLLASLSGAVLAGPCQDDITAIDKAMKTTQLPPEARAQAEDMRAQADGLCKAGNEREGLDVTAEAKALLNIE